MRFNTFYGYAKQCSNELRPGIKAVEETVKSVMGPSMKSSTLFLMRSSATPTLITLNTIPRTTLPLPT
jgi:hypothetical protein